MKTPARVHKWVDLRRIVTLCGAKPQVVDNLVQQFRAVDCKRCKDALATMAEDKLRALIERRQAGYLWGRRYFFTPRLVSEVFGDGRKLLGLSGVNTRPAFWVIRVDSKWLDERGSGTELLRDHLEEIYQAIEADFGTGEKENGELYANAKFPQACDIGVGCGWWQYEPSKVERKTRKAGKG